MAFGLLLGMGVFLADELARSNQGAESHSMEQIKHLKDFQVVEFRRYTIKEAEREHFAQYFESFFPEAFEQLGALAVGSFFERNDPSRFTWIRAFHNMDDRAKINAEFYYGPLWKEHASTLNSLMTDSDNVLLLTSINPEHSVAIYPAVDPVTEAKGAHGVVVAQIFAITAESVAVFVQEAEPIFSSYRAAGIREAGILVSFEGSNNFPQLPVRTDGHYLVWLGILKDNAALEARFNPLVEHSVQALSAAGVLRGTPELVVLDPTHRSRLRWWPEDGELARIRIPADAKWTTATTRRLGSIELRCTKVDAGPTRRAELERSARSER